MPRRPAAGVLVACLFVSGATALVYEVVWLRMLGLVFGHSVYAITAILAAWGATASTLEMTSEIL